MPSAQRKAICYDILVIITSLLSKIFQIYPCWIFQCKVKFPNVTCNSPLGKIWQIWPSIYQWLNSTNWFEEWSTSYKRELYFILKSSAWEVQKIVLRREVWITSLQFKKVLFFASNLLNMSSHKGKPSSLYFKWTQINRINTNHRQIKI